MKEATHNVWLNSRYVLLAILYWLMIGLVLLALALFVFGMLGLIDNPEFRQQFEEALLPLRKGAAKP